jgi:hypothetical protein
MAPLQQQNISVPMAADLDTKTDPINSKLGQSLADCENGRFDHPGKIESRAGSVLIENTCLDADETLVDHNAVVGTDGGGLFTISKRQNTTLGDKLLPDGWTTQQVDPINATTKYIGHHSLAKLTLGKSISTITQPNTFVRSKNVAYHSATNYTCLVYNLSTVFDHLPNAEIVIVETSTGNEVLRTTLSTAGYLVNSVGVVTLDDVFLVYAHADSTPTKLLYFSKINATTLAVTTNNIAEPLCAALGCCVINHATYGNCAFFADSNSHDCKVVDKTGTLKQTISITHTNYALSPLCCDRIYYEYAGAEYALVSWQQYADLKMYYVLIDNTGTIVKTETLLDARPASECNPTSRTSPYMGVSCITAVEEPAAGNGSGGHESLFKVHYELLSWARRPAGGSYPATSLFEYWRNKIYTVIVDIVAGVVGIGQTYFNNCIASKAFVLNRKAHIWLLHNSSNFLLSSPTWSIIDPPVQNTYLLKSTITPYTFDSYPNANYNLVPHTVAKISNAGIMLEDDFSMYGTEQFARTPPSVIVLPNNRHVLVIENLDALNIEGQQHLIGNIAFGSIYAIQSIKLATIDMVNEKPSTKVKIGNDALVGGGCIDLLDGDCKPINFNIFPDPVYAVESAAAGNMGSGKYAYVAIYQSRTKTGELIRSAPSIVGNMSTVTLIDSAVKAAIDPVAMGSNWDSVIEAITAGSEGNAWSMDLVSSTYLIKFEDVGLKKVSIYYNATVTTWADLDALFPSASLAKRSGTGGATPVTGTFWDKYFSGGLSGTKAVDLEVPCCHECMPNTVAGDKGIEIILYRCKDYQTSGVNSFYRVATLANNLSTSYVSFTDTADDASLDYDDVLYTNGGVLENASPPMSNLMMYEGGRVYLVPDEDRTTLWYSKTKGQGTAIEFSSFLTKQMPDGGDITGLAFIDGKVIVFKRNKIRYFYGDGPNNLGIGDFSPDILLIPDVGCRSVLARNDDGVVFQSDRGIHALTRSMQIKHMGEKTDRYNDIDAIGTVVCKGNEELRFILANDITRKVFEPNNIAASTDGARFSCGASIYQYSKGGNLYKRWVASVYDTKLKYTTISNFILHDSFGKGASFSETNVVKVGDYNLALGFAYPDAYMYMNRVSAIAKGGFSEPTDTPAATSSGPLHLDHLHSHCVCTNGSTTDLVAVAYKERDTECVFLSFYDESGGHFYTGNPNLGYISPTLSIKCGTTFVSCQRVYNAADSKYHIVVTWGLGTATYYVTVAEGDIISTTPAILPNANDPANRKVFGVKIAIPYLDGTVETYPEKQIHLVYNYLLDKWGIDKRAASIFDTAYLGSDLYMVDCAAAMYREDSGTFLDNTTAVPLKIKTGWLTFGNVQGFGRVWWIYFIGQYTMSYTATVKIYYDYEETLRPGTTYTITGTDPSQFRIKPKYQKCEAMNIEITLTPTGTVGTANKLSLSALDFVLGVKKGLHKIAQARSL